MARINPTDERPEDNEEEELNLEPKEETLEEELEPDIPEKYKGKTIQEIVQMHQEAEKLLGRQSSEVGDLRKVVDEYIQSQLDAKAPQEEEPDEEIDFFTDPTTAINRAVDKHPTVREAAEQAKKYERQMTEEKLNKKHPDAREVVADPSFAEWIKSSKVRTELFVRADTQYDFDAADELLSTWKERQKQVKETAEADKETRRKAVRGASTGNTKASTEGHKKRTYRRTDIIKLMKTDPERYNELSDEILKAYREGRVK